MSAPIYEPKCEVCGRKIEKGERYYEVEIRGVVNYTRDELKRIYEKEKQKGSKLFNLLYPTFENFLDNMKFPSPLSIEVCEECLLKMVNIFPRQLLEKLEEYTGAPVERLRK